MSNPLIHTDTKQTDLPILIFIHGWPDSANLWQFQVNFFSKKYRCVCVTLPAFSSEERDGADFPELVERLVATIQLVKGKASTPVTLVAHDWGAYITYLLDQKYPTLVDRLITMDVGAHV